MAERRMFAKTIIDSDMFLDMSLSTQALYFHLSMRADDDGFVNNPKKIQRMIGCGDDELKMLVAKKFIIPFESGICVIKHWRIHNYIQNDRYTETNYKFEKSTLNIDENKSYTFEETGRKLIKNKIINVGNELSPNCIHDGYSSETQVRLDKVRLDKVRLGKDNNTISKDIVSSTKVQPIIDSWNSLGLQKIISINQNTNRYKLLNARLNEHGIENVLKAIENIKNSSFLKGQNNKNWTVTFDWMIKPNNFIKVLEGNYTDKEVKESSNVNPMKFNNFEAREYNYDDLENKLLGWDK